MRRNYILASSLAFYLSLIKAQTPTPEPQTIDQTDIQVVYNHYMQDGDNSAVTGGEGTERLIVYGPSFSIQQSFGKNAVSLQLGTDVISSASLDNIDTIESSASRLDARTYTDIGYSRNFIDSKLTLNGGVSFSIESDYFSFGKHLGANKVSDNGLTNYSAQLDIFNDDLRWGRLDDGFLKPPQFLIYPEELRFKEWYDEEKRNSYNLNLGLSQVIDKKNILGFYGVLSFQEGLLATPFHRVFFSDGTRGVEQLPDNRTKASLAVRWNTFIGGRLVLRSRVNGYGDTFGILGLAGELEAVYKVDSRWNLTPSARLYSQKESKYFARKNEHNSQDTYYTSDFDLSKFTSFNIGLEVKHTPLGKSQNSNRDFRWRYNFYGRSNKLTTHSLSFVMQIRSYSKRKK